MHKGFKDRLAELERLEAIDATLRGPLTVADGIALLGQLALSNITLRDDGRARRSWALASAERTADLDAAIARYNARLATELRMPGTTEEMIVVLLNAVWPVLLEHEDEQTRDELLPPWVRGLLEEKIDGYEEL